MSYMVAQLRKQDNYDYMIPQTISGATVKSQNIFNEFSTTNFIDFAWSGNFKVGTVYYLRFSIKDIKEGTYEKIDPSSHYTSDSINRISFDVTLRSGIQLQHQETEENIGNGITRITPDGIEEDRYSVFSYVFTPTANFNYIVLKINRQAFDVFNMDKINNDPPMPRENWLVNNIGQVNLYELKNIIGENQPSWLKFGYQGRPGSLIVVNKEPIRIGRSGIYEINNGTQITSFMLAAPNNNIEAFLLDYAYET